MEEKSQQKMSPKEMLEKLEKDFRERGLKVSRMDPKKDQIYTVVFPQH
ncbi:MAG: hypothetical protein II844_02835 [Prevotella sp.]|nr:hypothetical protein [Prevotella sp.]